MRAASTPRACPQALEATSRLLGASGAILEVIDKPAQRPVEFFSVGLPDLARIPDLEQFAALNPRIPFALRQRAGAIIWDRQHAYGRTLNGP